MDGIERIRDRLIVLLFAVGIALPLLGALGGRARDTVLAENRRAAEAPRLPMSLDALAGFTMRFEKFYDDAFGFRPTLLRWHSIVKTCWLGVSASDKVVIGKDGWFFLQSEDAMESYRATRPFDPRELTLWERVLAAREAWLEMHGIHYLVVVAPDAQTVYPEYVPAAFNRVNPMSRLDQLAAGLRERGVVPFLDLRPDLLEAKTRDRVYWKTDTHWNDRGAFAAYRRIVLALSHWYPAFAPLPREAFADVVMPRAGGDLAGMLGLPDVFREDLLLLQRRTPFRWHVADPGLPVTHVPAGPSDPLATEAADPTLPRGLVLRDSFALALIPFLAEHFQRIVYLPTHDLSPADIEREHPNVVIEEFVERMLMRPPPGNRPEVLGAGLLREWGAAAARH